MDRLTEQDGNQWSFIACRDCVKPHCTDCERFREQAKKLAAYEDTGLTPEEVAELARGKDEGRMLEHFVVNQDLFGRYAKIPTGHGGDIHVYKIVTSFESNSYCDVPLCYGIAPTQHDVIVPVLNVIHCGIDESEVVRVALSDCEIIGCARSEMEDALS